ncbi:MAG: hypothetical protein AAF547_06980 [Actinomycetota bacterium]
MACRTRASVNGPPPGSWVLYHSCRWLADGGVSTVKAASLSNAVPSIVPNCWIMSSSLACMAATRLPPESKPIRVMESSSGRPSQ